MMVFYIFYSTLSNHSIFQVNKVQSPYFRNILGHNNKKKTFNYLVMLVAPFKLICEFELVFCRVSGSKGSSRSSSSSIILMSRNDGR